MHLPIAGNEFLERHSGPPVRRTSGAACRTPPGPLKHRATSQRHLWKPMFSFFRRFTNSRFGRWFSALFLIAILAGFAISDLSNLVSGSIGLGMGNSTRPRSATSRLPTRKCSQAVDRRLQEVRQQQPTASFATMRPCASSTCRGGRGLRTRRTPSRNPGFCCSPPLDARWWLAGREMRCGSGRAGRAGGGVRRVLSHDATDGAGHVRRDVLRGGRIRGVPLTLEIRGPGGTRGSANRASVYFSHMEGDTTRITALAATRKDASEYSQNCRVARVASSLYNSTLGTGLQPGHQPIEQSHGCSAPRVAGRREIEARTEVCRDGDQRERPAPAPQPAAVGNNTNSGMTIQPRAGEQVNDVGWTAG